MKTIISLLLLVTIAGCGEKEERPDQRSYRMGFQNSAPQFDNIDLFIQSLELWTQRADAAIITTEVPWAKLLGGQSAVQYAVENYKGLVEYYRSKNLKLWIYIDPQNGLARESDALELVAVGKSISQPEMQAIYRRFVVVMDSLYRPEHLGLALETNLIKAATLLNPAIYEGVKQAANDAANDVRAFDAEVKLSVSVQVDYAWGKLGGGSYRGIAQDFIDFPFIDELGLSSYPYFEFDKPEEIPLDYYSKLVEGKSIPVFVSEGGWSSQAPPASSFIRSNQIQSDYIKHHKLLLDRVGAIAVFQLPFTDIDLAALPPDVPDNIANFIYLGLVDIQLEPKPALSAWDNLFKIPLADGH